MAIEVRQLSWRDTLRLQRYVSVPSFLWGLAAPNPSFVPHLARGDAGRATMRFFSDLRQDYRAAHLWSWFAVSKTLLVLDPESIDAVLRSDQNAADPFLKKHALSQFVPDALVISSGTEWQLRRSFNEGVLGFGGAPGHAEAFTQIVAREVDRLIARRLDALRWPDFQAFAEAVSHQILLGPEQRRPEMTGQLARMARRSNWVVLPRRMHDFSAFYAQIERDLSRYHMPDDMPGADTAAPSARCLFHEAAQRLASGNANASTQVSTQIGFWFFVLKDALELHVARTLALIAAHADVQNRVRQEVRDVGPLTAEAIERLPYLDACIREQLRLWTPVPILLRRVPRAFSLREEIPIQAGQQILIHTGFYHRDPRVFGELADRFAPESVGGLPPVYYFSAHRQSCAGQFLVMFALKAVLAALLVRLRFELLRPVVEPGRIPYLYNHFQIELRPLGGHER